MNFPVIIHKDKDSDYGVIIPDLLGCFSAGDSYEDALANTREAIECHIEGLLEDGEPVPQAMSIEQHKSNEFAKDGVFALVPVDLSKLSGKVKRVNITFPERLLSQVDSYAGSHGESRSGLLVSAALEYISRHTKTA
ncbi:MAG: type II toxin-antitoxin system HicB family antitoxin [Opitutaceae bacterium]